MQNSPRHLLEPSRIGANRSEWKCGKIFDRISTHLLEIFSVWEAWIWFSLALSLNFLFFQLTHIDDFAFSQLSQLALLDLSSNRLESLPVNALYDSLLPKSNGMLRSLLLHSKIVVINAENFRNLKIAILDNPWRCDKDLMWLRKWLRENGDVRITASGAHTARWE